MATRLLPKASLEVMETFDPNMIFVLIDDDHHNDPGRYLDHDDNDGYLDDVDDHHQSVAHPPAF